MNGTSSADATMSKAGLLMIGLLTGLLLGGCGGSSPTDLPTAAPTATLSAEAAAALEDLALSAFRKGKCGDCHTMGRVAFAKIGPDLNDIGARADAAYIRESIVDPSAVIAENCPNGPCPSDPEDVRTMRLTYAHPLTDEEVDALVRYLTGLMGE